MRGTVLYGPRDVRFEDRPEPKITKPTDAIVSLSATCNLRIRSVALSRYPADCSADPNGARVLRHSRRGR